jgi:hypothetical protein
MCCFQATLDLGLTHLLHCRCEAGREHRGSFGGGVVRWNDRKAVRGGRCVRCGT